MKANKEQSGNVLFLILIAVALFAALSYTVTRSTRSGGNADKEKVLISIATADSIHVSLETTIMRLRLSLCDDTELSFWHDSNGDGTENASDLYYNPNSPLDRSCHIYDPNGGALPYIDPVTQYGPVQTGYPNITWVVSGGINFSGTQSTDPDLGIQVRNISDAFCDEVNERNGNGIVNSSDGTCYVARFRGNYTLAGCSDNQGGGRLEYCTNQFGSNVYYKRIINR